jgi:hypothetical protein
MAAVTVTVKRGVSYSGLVEKLAAIGIRET